LVNFFVQSSLQKKVVYRQKNIGSNSFKNHILMSSPPPSLPPFHEISPGGLLKIRILLLCLVIQNQKPFTEYEKYQLFAKSFAQVLGIKYTPPPETLIPPIRFGDFCTMFICVMHVVEDDKFRCDSIAYLKDYKAFGVFC